MMTPPRHPRPSPHSYCCGHCGKSIHQDDEPLMWVRVICEHETLYLHEHCEARMENCQRCQQQPGRYCRTCADMEAGQHLFAVMQAEMMRSRPGADMPQLAWARQPGDLQRAYVVGARAMRELER